MNPDVYIKSKVLTSEANGWLAASKGPRRDFDASTPEDESGADMTRNEMDV